MARTVAGLPEGPRVTDYISLGAVAGWVPLERVNRVLERLGRQSQRKRQLPAHVMVYYVIALALYMGVSYGEVLRSLVEGLEWIGLPVRRIRTTGASGTSQARTRLGSGPGTRWGNHSLGEVLDLEAVHLSNCPVWPPSGRQPGVAADHL